MRVFVLVMLALLSACSSNPTKTSLGSDDSKLVQVTGTGYTFDEAKANGFNRAIEYVVGSVILTAKESKKDSLVRDEIINHSSGYVDSFTIVSEQRSGSKVHVTMDVYVKHSKIANRILNKDKESTNVDGQVLSAQYATYLNSRKTATAAYKAVLNDYPRKAFTVKKTKSEFMLDRNNNARFLVSYKLDWNYNYIVALNEVLSLAADPKNSGPMQNKVVVNSMKPGNWVMGDSAIYYFNDDALYDVIYQKLNVYTVVYAKLLDANNRVVKCGAVTHSMVLGGSSLLVQGAISTQSTIDISIDSSLVLRLSEAHMVELGITDDMDYCRQF